MRWNQNDIKLKIWKFSHKENILLVKQSKLFKHDSNHITIFLQPKKKKNTN